MLAQLLNQSTLDEQAQNKQRFNNAEPFKYVVIDDFFATDFCQNLLDEFPGFKDKDAFDENKTLGKKAVVQTVAQIGKSYQSLDQMVQSKAFLAMVENITGIDGLLYDPHYIGGGTHNNLNGQELDPHVDFTHHPLTSHHRRLNLIVYLNHEWDKSWGGNIEFHKNPRLSPEQDEVTSVVPLFNRAVIFETHNLSWHGFTPIKLPDDKKDISRKSFALYYYTHKRQEPVEPHSTIYVERHLSEKFQLGTTLQAEDVAELKSMLGRRDQHLARLYKTITAQTIEISQIKTQLLTLKALGVEPNKQTQELEQQLASLSFDETRLINRVLEMENSTSWKITAPIRALKRWLTRKS